MEQIAILLIGSGGIVLAFWAWSEISRLSRRISDLEDDLYGKEPSDDN